MGKTVFNNKGTSNDRARRIGHEYSLDALRNSEAKWKTNCHTIPFISYDVFQNGEILGKHGALKRGTSASHRTTMENKDAAANVTAKSIWFKRQLDMAVAAVGSVALCATMAFVAALTGYVSSSDLDSAAYKMAASQAEITESLITDSDGVRKVYNSAAIAFPDGHADSYQKMHRAGSEETAWSLPGSTPVMFEMPEWTGSDGKPLKAGIDICRDGHFYPELGRYYAASGVELFLHPTATTGNAWYRESRMGSYTDRDGLAVITDNVWGPDGYPLDVDGNPIYFVDEDGDTVSSGKDIAGYNYAGVGFDPFRTSSLIINAWSGKDGTPFDYSTGSALDASGTGKGASDSESSDMTFAEGAYDPDNLEIRQMNLSRAGFSVMNFNVRLYSKMYDQLAKLTIPGYQAMYDDPTELDNTTFSSEQNGLVSNAATLLNTALDGLKLRETKPDDQPGGGEAKPNDKQPSKDKNASKADGKPTADSPRTGSDIVPIIAVMLLLAGAGTTAGTLIRRKHV